MYTPLYHDKALYKFTLIFFTLSMYHNWNIFQEFSTDLDFRGTWTDSRLMFRSNSDDPIYIPHKNIDNFWIPDLYFPNEKSGKTHEITIPNRSIRIYPNGTVRYLIRYVVLERLNNSDDSNTIKCGNNRCIATCGRPPR